MKLIYCNSYLDIFFKFILLSLFVSCQLWSMDPDYFNDADGWNLFSLDSSGYLDSPVTTNNHANPPHLPTPAIACGYEGQGQLLNEGPMAIEVGSRELADHNLDSICRKSHINAAEVEEIKNLNLPLSEINKITSSLDKKMPREANKLWNDFYRDHETARAAQKQISTGEQAKRKAESGIDAPASKKSRMHAGRDNDEQIRIGLENFLKVGREKNLNLDLVTSFFNSLPKSKIIESFTLFKDLNKHDATSYIQQKILAENPIINRGLKNSGSNCYLNSVLQVLSQISGFAVNIDEAIRLNEYSPNSQAQEKMHNMLSNIFKSMKGESDIFNPANASDYFRAFLRTNDDAPQDDGRGRQQDAQETYSAIFNRVVENKEKLAKDFEFLLEYSDTMSDETRRSIEEEAIRQNILHPDEKLVTTIHRPGVSTMLNLDVVNDSFTDLKSCLDKSLQEEILETNYWSTTNGKEINILKLFGRPKLVSRIKKIKQFPKILVFHLNRFNNQKNCLKKIDNNILFPIKMNASEYFQLDATLPSYELRGTIFHGGPSIHAGHYWAFVKNLVTKQYFCYNDETRTLISESEMENIGNFGENTQRKSIYDEIRGNAYMLFYELSE